MQSRDREAFGEGRALVVERMAREAAAHHESRKSALPLSHIKSFATLPVNCHKRAAVPASNRRFRIRVDHLFAKCP
jgi:hypothetical protein